MTTPRPRAPRPAAVRRRGGRSRARPLLLGVLVVGLAAAAFASASADARLRPLWVRVLDEGAPHAVGASPDGGARLHTVQDGALVAYDVRSGSVAWRAPLARRSTRPDRTHDVVADASGVYASTPRDIVAFDPRGRERWRVPSPEAGGATRLVREDGPAGRRLFVLADHGPVVALDPRSGRELWRTRPSGNYVAAHARGGVVVVQSVESGAITVDVTRAFDLATGTELWERTMTVPLHVGPDAAVLHRTGYPGLSDPTRIELTVVATRTGEQIAGRPLAFEGTGASPTVRLAGDVVLVGRNETVVRERRSPDGTVHHVATCCFVRALYVAPLRGEAPLRRVASDVPEGASWIATHGRYAFLARGTHAPAAREVAWADALLLRLDLRTGDLRAFGGVRAPVVALAAEGATAIALTEAGALLRLDVREGVVVERILVPGAAAGGARRAELEFVGDVVLVRVDDRLAAYAPAP